METYLLLFCVLYILGIIFFGHFEERTPKVRRLVKLAFNLGLVAVAYQWLGGAWAAGLIVALFALGLTFHFWWTSKNGIHPFTAEPRTKYYALRGWQ